MASIKLRRGSGVPSGLTFGEPAFDITNNRFYVGITGGSALVGVAGGGVHSFNGLTGAVTGVTTGTANTFGPLQSFTNGISAAGGITFNSPISSTRLSNFTSAALETKTSGFSPTNADNGKVFVMDYSGKTPINVTLDGLSVGWRAKFISVNNGSVGFNSSLGTVLGFYGANAGANTITQLDPMVEVICYGSNSYFAG